MQKTFFKITLAIILIMHSVGIYGILFSHHPGYYIDLTWANLLVTGLCFLIYSYASFEQNPSNMRRYFFAFLVVFVSGFLVEVAGVKSGLIFGVYHYGQTLGYRVWEVPLIIGLNWALLVLSVASIASKIYSGTWVRVIIGATLLTLLDMLIEPVAMYFYYWMWDIKSVPLQNFIGWWIVSFVMLLFCFKFVKDLYNRLGIWVYCIQLVFFTLLNLLLK